MRGDSAVIELAVRNAADFAQQLGPYSRFGWTHPGPIWFYALAPVYVLGGETAASLLAATLMLNAAFCVLIVLAASKHRTAPAMVSAAALLLLVLAAPGAVFAEIWNPYATVLPALLFLVLLARAADGSPIYLLGALIVGSFLVQTHLGTGLPVVVCVTVASLFVLLSRAPGMLAQLRTLRFTFRRSRIVAVCTAVAVLAAIWIQPLRDQLSGTRNLTTLARFLRATQSTGTGHTAAQGIVMIDRFVVPPQWSIDMTAVLAPGSVTARTICGLCGFVLINAAIAVLAWRRAARLAAYLAVLALLLVPLGIVAVVQIDGNLHNYLISWFLAAPAATVLAACLLFADIELTRSSNRTSGRTPSGSGFRTHIALSVSLVLLGGIATASLMPRAGHSADCCTQNSILNADRALAAATTHPTHAGAPINIQYDANGEWPLATALAATLAEHGWSPRLPPSAAWTFKLTADADADADDPTIPTVWIRSGTEAPLAGYRVIARVPGVAMWQQGDYVGVVELRMPG